MNYRILAAVLALACVVGSACGGEDDPPPLPSATPDTFDDNVLAAIALQQDEVGGLPVATSGLSGDETGFTYSVTYGDEAYKIQSTVARKPDVVSREVYFDSVRLAAISFIDNEQNYELEGTDLAFTYEGRNTGVVQASVLALRGDFIMHTLITSNDPNRTSDVINDATRRRYAELKNERTRQAIEASGNLPLPTAAPSVEVN